MNNFRSMRRECIYIVNTIFKKLVSDSQLGLLQGNKRSSEERYLSV